MMLALFKKIKAHGWEWLVARLLDKVNQRSSFLFFLLGPVVSFLYYFFIVPYNKCRCLQLTHKKHNEKFLYMFYDLEMCPITFDFAWALALAEHERKKQGLFGIKVYFVPGKLNGLRRETQDYDSIVNYESRRWRLMHVLSALCHLLPTCVGFTFCVSRDEATLIAAKVHPHCYPKRYSVQFPTTHVLGHVLRNEPSFQMPFEAPVKALQYINQWLTSRLQGRKLITITLRTYDYQLMRNSNLQAWSAFAKGLDSNKYFIVFVPDIDVAMDPIPVELSAFTFFNEACWNLELRAAIYQKAYLNMGVNNGVMSLCWLNKQCRYLTFKMTAKGAPQTEEKAMWLQGFQYNKSLPCATPFQKLVWEADDEAVIWREFDIMIGKIEAHTSSAGEVVHEPYISA